MGVMNSGNLEYEIAGISLGVYGWQSCELLYDIGRLVIQED